MKYDDPLNQRRLIKSEVEGRFDDIEAWINTHKTPAAFFEKNTLGFRHLYRPPVIALCHHQDPLTILGIPVWGGWYRSTLRVSHKALHQSLHHEGTDSLYPSTVVAAFVGLTNSDPEGLYKMCLGYSTDGGFNWTPLDGTGGTKDTTRYFGQGRGLAPNYYDSHLQTHYLTGAANYYPKNFPSDHPVETVAYFGGDDGGFGDPTVITDYAVFFNATNAEPCMPWGFLTLDSDERAP